MICFVRFQVRWQGGPAGFGKPNVAVDFLFEVFFVPFFGAQNDGCIFVVGHKNWHFFFPFIVGPSDLADSFRPRS